MSNLAKKSNQQFGFSGVKESTGLIIVDECPENFAFNELYAKISDDMEVERKGKDPVVIPFSKAPKFGIATNHTLKDHSCRASIAVLSSSRHTSHMSHSDSCSQRIYLSLYL